MPPDTDVTRLLIAWSGGEEAAAAPLMDAVYAELRHLARGYLLRERRDHSLAATALVHEAYVKLVDQRRVQWQNRAHFFAVASRVMRRLLVDHARAHAAAKRGAGLTVSLDGIDPGAPGEDPDVIALDQALEKLARLDPRQARLVELRFFGGLTVEETAEAMDISPATVKRHWTVARAWLARELEGLDSRP
jgi:RNA polymerase sigma-70 factor (ECF subfamily)